MIHPSINAWGWSVSHIVTATAVVTRLPDRSAAHRARTALLAMPGTVWTAVNPFHDEVARKAVLVFVRTLPRKQSSKPLRIVNEQPEPVLSPSRVLCGWTVRDMGVNGHHDQPLLLPLTEPVTRAEQRARLQLENTLYRAIPPIPIGALVAYYRHGQLRGGLDEPEEGRVIKAKYHRHDKQWRFYLSNGVSLRGRQIRTVSILRDAEQALVEDEALCAEPRTCYSCRGFLWWRSIYGARSCAACHPPATPTLIATWSDTAQQRTEGGDGPQQR
jgi:hypothetical protein